MSGGTHAADLSSTFTGITIEDIQFRVSIICYKDQVMQQITQPMYSVATEAYNCFEVNWTASTQIEQPLPFKYVSFKN